MALGVACGARTELDVGGDAAARPPDAGADRVVVDVRSVDVVLEDVIQPSACTVTSDDPSFGATESIDACSEGQNISYPLDPNCGGGSAGWEYVPAHDIEVTRLELDVTGGGVALYDSVNDTPGAKLFEGSFDSGPQKWRGVSRLLLHPAGHPGRRGALLDRDPRRGAASVQPARLWGEPGVDRAVHLAAVGRARDRDLPVDARR